MPGRYLVALADRLDSICAPGVVVPAHMDVLVAGTIYIAPGDTHLVVRKSSGKLFAQLTSTPKVHHQRPSVDVLFESVARQVQSRSIGVILTGMGADGAAGLLQMRKAGAHTIGQDEATCTVYGMPKQAAEQGAVTEVLPLDGIAPVLTALAGPSKVKGAA